MVSSNRLYNNNQLLEVVGLACLYYPTTSHPPSHPGRTDAQADTAKYIWEFPACLHAGARTCQFAARIHFISLKKSLKRTTSMSSSMELSSDEMEMDSSDSDEMIEDFMASPLQKNPFHQQSDDNRLRWHTIKRINKVIQTGKHF